MKRIVIGGVPEHFNLPWHLLIEGTYGGRATDALVWRDFPEGSGAMVRALRAAEIDVAVMLTEAALAADAADFEIVSQFTDSPLIWGIHTPALGPIAREHEIRDKRYAISRPGSGSHLISVAHAQSQGWGLDGLRFVEVGTLAGAVEAFAAGSADVFFWEKFMTQPLVDAGTFRRVGEFVAPWPAFVVCARKAVLRQDAAGIRDMIDKVGETAQRFHSDSQAGKTIAQRYGLDVGDAEQWLQLTRWSRGCSIDTAMLERVRALIGALRLTGAR